MAVKDTFSVLTYGWRDPDGAKKEPYIYRFGCMVDNETMWAAGALTTQTHNQTAASQYTTSI